MKQKKVYTRKWDCIYYERCLSETALSARYRHEFHNPDFCHACIRYEASEEPCGDYLVNIAGYCKLFNTLFGQSPGILADQF